MTTRIFGHAVVCAGIVALLALLLPSAAWAHRCGPQTLKVKKGDTIWYVITGSSVASPHYIDYHIIDKGDPLVAKIEPPMNKDDYDAMFKIVGAGNGATMFKIDWVNATRASRRGSCRVNVTVHE